MTEEELLKEISILTMDDVKVVKKPWGEEKWIANGLPNFPYAFKQILIKAPHKSSIQFHKDKMETNYIVSGRGILYYSTEPINVQKFVNNEYTKEELGQIISGLKQKEVVPGEVFHVAPGYIHRIEAVEDLTMMEASTTELDDVYRLQDDSGRGHGKIEGEHQ